MSSIPDTRNRLADLWFVTAIVQTCRAGRRALARIIRRQRRRAHLAELSDHLLRDIGIDRSEIGWITYVGGKDEIRRPRADRPESSPPAP